MEVRQPMSNGCATIMPDTSAKAKIGIDDQVQCVELESRSAKTAPYLSYKRYRCQVEMTSNE